MILWYQLNSFHSNNFKLFELSFQSPFHLSLTVLVRYRSLIHRYLASDGVYHLKKIFFKLHSQATWLVHQETRFNPCLTTMLCYTSNINLRVRECHPIFFIFPNITHANVYKNSAKYLIGYYAHGLSFTLHLCAAFPPAQILGLG